MQPMQPSVIFFPYNITAMNIHLDATDFAAVMLFEMEHPDIFSTVPTGLTIFQEVMLQSETLHYLQQHNMYKHKFGNLVVRLRNEGVELGRKMIEAQSIYI